MKVTVDIARTCLRRALALRKRVGVPTNFAVNPVDIAQSIGIEVWYQRLPSLAGMYERQAEAIVIGSDRPLGYQNSVCAHELGHHAFGHGTRIDEYIPEKIQERREDPEEVVADLFAAHLMMPEAAVRRAFELRRWDSRMPTAHQAFVIAGVLGVGYSALLNHLCWALHYLSPHGLGGLLAHTPQKIRQDMLPDVETSELIVVDENWTDRPVDVTVGTTVCLPMGSRLEGNALRLIGQRENAIVVQAYRRGIARVDRTTWSTFVRVMPDRFSGAAVHRHMEDPDEL